MSGVGEGLVLGAVSYDPKVVTIWDGFQAWFARRGFAFDAVLYTHYERLVEALLAGHVDVAWNSPLAWLQAEAAASRRGRSARAIGMRDTDRDLTSVLVGRADSGVASLGDLAGRRVAVGASDSPQATLIPMLHLAEAGLEPGRDVEIVRFDTLVGKHGDHIGGERDAARALMAGQADAAWMLDGNHLLFAREGVLSAGATRVLAQTAPYDHCNMTVLEGGSGGATKASVDRFTALLLEMSYADPEARPLLDLEGLRQWLPGRTSGYGQLARAIARFGTIEPWLARQ